ncbi:MAG: hypothetical protein Q9M31_01945 [Mariprofundus sp.]|nr:hypothetical protein [Mariprofundus sp.]
MRRLLILFSFLSLLIISGCSLYAASDQAGADQLVGQYHKAFKAKQWDSLLSLYDPSFFKQHSRDGWRDALAALSDRYGVLKQVHQSYAQKDPRFRGDYYIYGYRLLFEKKTINETITVFKGIESDKLTIAGHVLKEGGSD